MKKIAILGSTGSIGQNALRVARHLGNEKIQITALAASENIDLLEAQAREFSPTLIALYNKEKARELQQRLPQIEVLGGMEGLVAVAAHHDANMVISAMTGTAGLQPTIEAIRAGKDVGLANKEALISGGELIIQLAREKKINLIPIDSEHSAIFQCLRGESSDAVKRIILTASGGPFRTWSDEQLAKATVEQALNHPNWKMGPKVTVDCSTLMNKGLEVIEAHWLFNIDLDKIEVVIHPQSIIHSLVEFCDQSMKAQLSVPSMIIPIQYAMTYPDRLPGLLEPFDFIKHPLLEFAVPDRNRFNCLSLAYEAIRLGGTLPCYMNAVNEVLVNRFLAKEISWSAIGRGLEKLMARHSIQQANSLETILEVDAQAREEALKCDVEHHK